MDHSDPIVPGVPSDEDVAVWRVPANEDALDELVRSFRDDPLRRFLGRSSYHVTRFVFLRFTGAIYFVAFLCLTQQLGPLIGETGLLPAPAFLERVLAFTGSRGTAFAKVPTLFWLSSSDVALHTCAWIGLALSAAVCAGVTNALVQLALWALYLSFVQIGQVFYGYGWEIQLLETGFLAIFLCPVKSLKPFPDTIPETAVIWLLRWLIVRIMIGAGLIKLRGDPCWRDLTCLVYHYETQPVPNPLSWLLHQLPAGFHKSGVLFNHFVELVVPPFVFAPRAIRHVTGALLVAFQVFLILSGNLSFLNWLTIAPAIACFDDSVLERLLPARLRLHVRELASRAARSRLQRGAAYGLAAVVALLSVGPVGNMFSSRQAMNRSFEPLHLVNTYGAFGSVGRQRHEVILEGTRDEILGEQTVWQPYELPCKPGDVRRRPCIISPYHYRLDWQIWFAALSTYDAEPWIVHLVYKLLRGDPGVSRLLAVNPFSGDPPRYVRAELYRYEFTRIGDGTGAWWRRTRVSEYLRPLSVDDPELIDFLDRYAWER